MKKLTNVTKSIRGTRRIPRTPSRNNRPIHERIQPAEHHPLRGSRNRKNPPFRQLRAFNHRGCSVRRFGKGRKVRPEPGGLRSTLTKAGWCSRPSTRNPFPYEEFIEGLRASSDDKDVTKTLKRTAYFNSCDEARKNWELSEKDDSKIREESLVRQRMLDFIDDSIEK